MAACFSRQVVQMCAAVDCRRRRLAGREGADKKKSAGGTWKIEKKRKITFNGQKKNMMKEEECRGRRS